MVNAMRMQVRNRLTMLGEPVAAVVIPREPGRRAWIVVLPPDDEHHDFLVRRFEIEDHVLANEYDIHPGELLDMEEVSVAGIDGVDAAIRELGGDPETVDAPWRVDYPL